MSSRSWSSAAAVAAVVLGAYLALSVERGIDTGSEIAITAVLYLLSVISGLFVWRRGTARMGALIVLWGIASILSDAWAFFPGSRLSATTLPLLMDVSVAVYAHMILAYPSGRLRDRVDRAATCAFYVTSVLPAVVLMLTWSPPASCVDCRPSVRSYLFVGWLDREPAYDLANDLTAVMGALFLVLLVRRWLSAAPGARLGLWPIGVAAVFAVGEFFVGRAVEIWKLWSWDPVAQRLDQLAWLAVPLALALGVALGERRRRGVGDLVVELGATRPGRARDALAEALGDPSLELMLWEPEGERWITTAGTPAELPSDPDRAVTMIGDHLAAVVYDNDLADQVRIVTTAGSAARLALENERLQAELRAQLEELRASRARIVSVGDEQRRLLERDLHDGAQQRLLGVGLALQLLRPRLGAPADAEGVLQEAETELRTAIEELRELARGIHPALHTEQGLEPALQSLASRSTVPVTLETDGCGDLPVEIESTVYFVTAEAFANIAKHAHATSASVAVTRRNGTLRLVIRDDGRGGANPAGSGLLGLADRVGALGGRFAVESADGAGTRLDVEIPCASS